MQDCLLIKAFRAPRDFRDACHLRGFGQNKGVKVVLRPKKWIYIVMGKVCCMLSCSSNSKRNKNLSFYKVPTVITHQGNQTQNISKARCQQWLNNIKREDIKNGGYKYPLFALFTFIQVRPFKLRGIC